jgi:hypothetical protein
MASARYQPRTDRRRTASFLLAVLAHLILIWLLLRIGPSIVTRPPAPPPTTFSMLPDAATEAPKAAAQPHAAKAKASAASATPRRAPPAVPPPIVKPPPQAKPRPDDAPQSPSLFGDKSLFDAGDLAALPHGETGAGHDTGKDSASVYGPGEGSGGEQLFNADWYRKPTDAELSTYLPANVPAGSWGIIACRTAPRYHVENCRSIGESPVGSGIGRALRLAGWQFLVIPPRRGGKPLIGAWVRIRIDFTDRGIK